MSTIPIQRWRGQD